MNPQMNEAEEALKPVAVFYAYDNDKLDLYAHAVEYMCILDDIEQQLRKDYKYNDALSSDVITYIEGLRNFIAEAKAEYHLPLM